MMELNKVGHMKRSLIMVWVTAMLLSMAFLPMASALNYGNGTVLWDTDGSFEGWQHTHQTGNSVDIVGDLNGDGYDDFVIAGFWTNGATGEVYIQFGGTSGWGMNESLSNADASYVGEFWADNAGSDIEGAGDVNGDGYDDLLIAAQESDEGFTNAHQTYVIFGRPDNWTMGMSLADANASFIGEGDNHMAGSALAAAGDVNGDGFDDILIGAPGNSPFGHGSGMAYLIFGKASGWEMDTILSNANASFAGIVYEGNGHEVAGLGDVNGDGYDDFATATIYAGDRAGCTYVWFGKPDGWKMNTRVWEADAWFNGEVEWTYSGRSVTGGNDLNGDGFDDIVIATPEHSTTTAEVGKVYVIFGSDDEDYWKQDVGLDNATASFLGEGISHHLGIDVEMVGDVNGDRFGDFIAVAPENDEHIQNAGKVYLYLGKESGWQVNQSADVSDASFLGEENGDGEGDHYDLGGGGDVNGDGLDDFVIGAKLNIGPSDRSGKSWIIIPDSNTQPTTIGTVTVFSDQSYTQSTNTAKVYDEVYVEMDATDLDPARANVAIVNVTNDMDTRIPFRLRLYETGPNTGKFRGELTVWNATSKNHRRIGADPLDTVTIFSTEDPTKNVTITIDWPLPRIRPLTDNITAIEDTVYTERYWAFGGKPPLSWDVGIDKDWLTWDEGTKTFNGSPDNGDVGTTSVSITVNDALAESTVRAFNIEVLNTAPEIINEDVIAAVEDEYYEVDYNSTDDGNGTISWSTTSSIPWLSLDGDTGILNGTPTNDDIGTYLMNITVDDGNGGKDWHEFNLTVVNSNDLPLITSTPVTTAVEREVYNYQVNAFDIDPNTTLAFGLDISPAGMAIGPTTGMINWTPEPEQGGNNTVIINVTDGNDGWAVQSYNISVKTYPPTAVLLSPDNASVLDTERPELNWSGEDENDPVLFYDLFISEEKALVDSHDPTVRTVQGTTIGSYKFLTDLAPGATFYWTVVPDDGHHTGTNLNGTWSFVINLSLDNNPPMFTSNPITTVMAGKVYSYDVNANDIDPDEAMEYSLVTGPPGMTIDNVTGMITWSTNETMVGNYSIVIGVADTYVTITQSFNLEVTPPRVNHNPKITSISDHNVKSGESYTFLVMASDEDLDTLDYVLIDPPAGMTIDNASGLIEWKPARNQAGTHTIKVQVTDGENFVNKTYHLTVIKTAGAETGIPSQVFLALILAIVAVVIAVGYLAISRRKQSAAQTQAQEAMSTELQAMKVQISEQSEMVEDFHIEGAFLIYNDGRLVARNLTIDTKIDDQLFGSMLVAIQSFVKESFQAESGLDSFEFSGQQIVLIKGRFLILVVSLIGKEPPILRERIRKMLESIEGRYAGVVETWDGDLAVFAGADAMLAPLYRLKEELKVKKAKGDVRILSGLEFYEGYVRLKVAVINKLDTTITDASLNLTFNRDALRFDRIEPQLPHEGTTVQMGSVKPGEKKTIAYYLDPIICQESVVDCTLTFYDFKGEINHVNMKRRPVDIVCPIFYTPQTVNVAMLKRLLGDLQYHDSKIYRIADLPTLKTVFNEAKAVVGAHDVKFVREFTEDMPYEGEAWYYGEVSISDEKMVVRVTAREAQQVLEVFVASGNLATQAGLLAELGNELKARFVKHGIMEAAIVLETSLDVKKEMEKTGLLLDKYAEGEIPTEETTQR